MIFGDAIIDLFFLDKADFSGSQIYGFVREKGSELETKTIGVNSMQKGYTRNPIMKVHHIHMRK